MINRHLALVSIAKDHGDNIRELIEVNDCLHSEMQKKMILARETEDDGYRLDAQARYAELRQMVEESRIYSRRLDEYVRAEKEILEELKKI